MDRTRIVSRNRIAPLLGGRNQRRALYSDTVSWDVHVVVVVCCLDDDGWIASLLMDALGKQSWLFECILLFGCSALFPEAKIQLENPHEDEEQLSFDVD